MSIYRIALGLLAALFVWTSLASAIVVATGSGRVAGFLVSDDGTKLKIRVPSPDGEDKFSEFLRSDVTIVHQLDTKRLEGLSPEDAKGYRDYADVLARQEADPEARYTAMRLYLISAYLAPEEFGSSSLLRMSDLASTQAEARKYRALAYLLDPKGDADILKAKAVKPSAADQLPASALDNFTKAMQLYRTAQPKPATEFAKRDGVDRIFALTPEKLDVKKFLDWCNNANCTRCALNGTIVCPTCNGKGFVLGAFNQAEICSTCKRKKRVTCPDCGGTHVREPLPENTLRTVLRCEVWAIDRQNGGANAGSKEEAKGWSAVVQSRRLSPVMPLSLETISSFDPNKYLYRNRKWVEK